MTEDYEYDYQHFYYTIPKRAIKINNVDVIVVAPTGEIKLDIEYFAELGYPVSIEGKGEILNIVQSNSNALCRYRPGRNTFIPPFYEQDGDFDQYNSSKKVKRGYYYFVRPFPVEGVYVLEIYRRNDYCKEIDDQIAGLLIDVKDAKDKDAIKNYAEERTKITEGKDDKNMKHADYINLYNSSVSYFNNILLNQSNKYDKKCLAKEYSEYQEVMNDSSSTQEQKEEATNKWNTAVTAYHTFLESLATYSSKFDDICDFFFNVLFTRDGGKLIPSNNEEVVEEQKEYVEDMLNKYQEDIMKYYGYASIVSLGSTSFSSQDSKKFIDLSTSYSKIRNYCTDLTDLDWNYWKALLPLYKNETKLNDLKEQRKEYEKSNTLDRKMLAYKILNRGEAYADGFGFYRIVDDIGGGKFRITTKNKTDKTYEVVRIVDNTKLYEKWETPDKYYIEYKSGVDKDDPPDFRVVCCKDGFFSDTDGILTFIYEGNNSTPILGDEFNLYGDSKCSCLNSFKTEFKYTPKLKIYKTKVSCSSTTGCFNKVRYGVFNAKAPFPVEDKVETEKITLAEYKKKPKSEQVKYHKIGSPSMDADMQKVMESLEQVKPILTSLAPLNQVMGSLSPLIGTLESVESSLKTIQSTIDSVMSIINTIAGLPVVSVVAKPLKGLLDIILSLVGAVITFYMENYVLLKKIRTVLEQLKPEEIKNNLDKAVETVEKHYKNLSEKVSNVMDTGKELKENDKKKMDIESPIKDDNKIDIKGTGKSSFADFNAAALVPEIPPELKQQIETVKSAANNAKQLIDKAVTLTQYGKQVDSAMTNISKAKAIITATPPMEVISEDIRKAWMPEYNKMKAKLDDFNDKQKELEKEAKLRKENSLRYEKSEQVGIDITFKSAVGKETIKARSKPKVKG